MPDDDSTQKKPQGLIAVEEDYSGVSRRDFLKTTAGIAAGAALGESLLPRDASALTSSIAVLAASKRPSRSAKRHYPICCRHGKKNSILWSCANCLSPSATRS